jgi:hypothetical protein
MLFRFDQEHGIFLHCNTAQDILPIMGVGIDWDAYLLRRQIIINDK